jgi:hypothetical protein
MQDNGLQNSLMSATQPHSRNQMSCGAYSLWPLVVVKAMGEQGQRLNIRKATPREWLHCSHGVGQVRG